MTDIFDTTILCKKCHKEMQGCIVSQNGMELRAVKCKTCGDTIIHPADLNGMENFKDLKDKKFNVKLRMVGNSHAISIPKEIIDFMNERQREMKRHMDAVSLAFDDFDTLRLKFRDDNFDDEDDIDEEIEKEGNIKRSVRDYGKGNMDIIEEKTINKDGKHVKKVSVRKIRRNYS